MNSDALDTIADPAILRRMVLETTAAMAARDQQISALNSSHVQALRERDAEIEKRDADIRCKSAKIEKLTHLLALLHRAQFSARSEKFDPTQQALFDEAVTEQIAALECEIEALTPPAKRERTAPKRQPLPAELPRVETRIEPVSCVCGECGGDLQHIGDETSETLDIEPLKFFVRKTIRPKYTCRACETVVTAPTLPAVVERGIASPGLLAYVVNSKLNDHVPLYRQCEILGRSGVQLSRSTLSGWVGACGFALQPLVDALRAQLHRSSVIHADETPVRMLDPRAGRGKSRTTYFFSYRRGEIDEPPIIVFDFATSRSGAHAREFLADYDGALVVDDYAGYKHLFQQTPMRELACWAHARRKFFDLHAANKSDIAHDALTRIAALYVVESQARSFDADERKAHREQYARPRVEQLYAWLAQLRPQINSASATANAVDYLLRRKPAFTAYLDDGRFPIDNNPVENAIRPVALGRKNWLFIGSENMGHRTANLMSLIQTAKANGHDPYAYLKDVLTRLPTHLNSRIEELLPHTWKPAAP